MYFCGMVSVLDMRRAEGRDVLDYQQVSSFLKDYAKPRDRLVRFITRWNGASHVSPRVTVPRDGEKPFVPMGCFSSSVKKSVWFVAFSSDNTVCGDDLTQ